jgi:hypothetical protein
MSNATKVSKVCTCASCAGASCTCGCQSTIPEAQRETQSACSCGDACTCGPDCACVRGATCTCASV